MIDPSLLLRAARRRTGLSQREFAALSGVTRRALASAEAGDHAPSWQTLERAVEAAGLSLALVPAVDDASPELRRFLAMAASYRLLIPLHPRRDVMEALGALTRRASVHVTGPAAVPVWVPGVGVPVPVPVRVHDVRRDGPSSPLLDVQEVAGPLPLPLVPVRLPRSDLFHVDDPTALSLRQDCAEHAQALRVAARCLHEGQPFDEAARRRPPHRDPDERREAAYLFHIKSFRPYDLPDAQDSRAWRLGGSVSLNQWAGGARG